MKELKIFEMFAGVGGFRVGLEKSNNTFYKTLWANQWEPSRKSQDAFNCYNSHFPNSSNMNIDISTISNNQLQNINANLIVGGFPCQDYSVARSLSGSKGINGKKGVLFWEIIRSIENINPDYLILENVDRLLKSPSKQRGRDFSIMLSKLNNLNYSVEWRVINAAEYSMPQRRKRVFIFIYKNNTSIYKMMNQFSNNEIIFNKGLFAQEFKIESSINKKRHIQNILPSDLVDITDNFSTDFFNSGIMRNGEYTSIDTIPIKSEIFPLSKILIPENEVEDKYFLDPSEIEKFNYLRGSKKIKRTSSSGHEYIFSEGSMSETDDISKPGRTMLTSEGTKNRSSHIVKVNNKIRFLTPIECERLNCFPDNWTESMSDRMRYFCMGNALVTEVITKIGNRLYLLIKEGDNL